MTDDWNIQNEIVDNDDFPYAVVPADKLKLFRQKLIDELWDETKLWNEYHIPQYEEDRMADKIRRINKLFGVDD